jgi:ABC-2 type transport system permease protein
VSKTGQAGSFAIARHESFKMYVLPGSYWVLSGYLLLAGYFFFNLLGGFNQHLNQFAQAPVAGLQSTANLNQWVVESYFHSLIMLLVFLVPLITMRVFSEEQRRQTLELLLTSPISTFSIVSGKFLGVLFYLIPLLLLSFVFPFLLCIWGNPEVLPMVSGCLGVLASAAAFVAIGIAFSALSSNQFLAGVGSVIFLLGLYAIHAPAETLGEFGAAILRSLSPMWQVKDLLQGVIAIEPLIYFVGITVVALSVACQAVNHRREV